MKIQRNFSWASTIAIFIAFISAIDMTLGAQTRAIYLMLTAIFVLLYERVGFRKRKRKR